MGRTYVKKLAFITTACMLALLTAFTFPLRVFAQASDTDANNGKYISEVKVGMGRDAAAAAAALNGYTILSDENKAFVDLNQGAGGGFASKGEKVVYLGYKTTDDDKDAITDLAVMNMKGGYSVQEYEALMDTYVKEQIDPLLDRLCAAIKEYRVNFSSQNESNRLRAKYIHDALNKLIDDDTGKGLGDLLLNRTKYEMGDEAYEALSDIQKNNTADIVTIFAQSNGAATLLIENLLARAADTGDDTWLDRFAAVTYDDMVADMTGGSDMFPTDAEAELARLCEDDARKILSLWDDLAVQLSGYDNAVEIVENYDPDAYSEDDEESVRALIEAMDAANTVAVYEYLDGIEYSGGTLLEFFQRSSEDVDIKEVYPIAAAFSDGQKAGLDFISLFELMIIAMTDGAGYADAKLDSMRPMSVYAGVDRAIYQKGGVALTSEALRSKAAADTGRESYVPSEFSIALVVLAGISLAAMSAVLIYMPNITDITNKAQAIYRDSVTIEAIDIETLRKSLLGTSAVCKELAIGLGVVTVYFIALSAYSAYRDLVAYYNVEFTPIPHYMVDEKDITVYNAKGERVVLKNQTAYYKAVECSRTEADKMFGSLGSCADLGGDVGRQWLALYAVKNEAMTPVLADSLKAVVGSSELPANYTTGIHMFGSGSAANLNDPRFVWNAEAPSVYVYFSADDSVKRNAAGSVFSGGLLALCAAAGIAVGAAITYLSMLAVRKKEDPILE